ncbi:polysaccharide pyruvyl transferase family protein [Pelagicoccus albus]|uniref:Polysaccharide pyruvyl transferase family protein n=1 Tax=Pelagicoccus albus TaxID=415222 RepID=A0A7X1B843_9BACT|nr:polysaccharide pyruvyl transferase family protein [Pelagicoccus albus]MBC2607406.1 polysaccharide pyruvyl transferase family protein [Pelagicoccus albus]
MERNEIDSLHVGIVGGTFTGNRGAQAMLAVCVREMRKRYPGCTIHVLTYYPDADRNEKLDTDVYVHSATPVRLVLNWVPLFLLARLFGVGKNPPKEHGLGFLQLAKLDLVLDVAGVGYIDGREKFLPYNVLTSLPFSLLGVPYFKLSQAIGPIGSLPNRVCANLALARVSRIFARGAMTEKHLKKAFPEGGNIDAAADLAFLLAPSNPVKPIAQRERRVGIVASSLVMSKNDGYISTLAEVCIALLNQGWEVVLIAHSWRGQTTKLRNNDLPALDAIAAYDERLGCLPRIGEGLDASELKSQIGSCRVILTSRFHGMIAALSTATPVVVAGWSHKYREVMEMFGLERFCLPHDKANVESLVGCISELDKDASLVSKSILEKLPEIRSNSESQFDKVCAAVNFERE